MSGDLQREKRDHQKREHEQVEEYEGPAVPARALSIGDPEPPPADVDLPAPGADTGGNELLATIEPAAFDIPDVASPDAGGGGGGGAETGGAGGGGAGAGGGGASGPGTK